MCDRSLIQHFMISADYIANGGFQSVELKTGKTSPFYGGIRSADCWLSRAIGSQNAAVLMLRKLLLLERS